MKLTNKEKYRQLCIEEDSIPIFSQAWWLDSVTDGNWDVVLIEKGGKIEASLPYVLKKRYGMTIITQPSLTQTLGPWIRESKAKYAKQLSQEKDLLQELYALLPDFNYYSQNWHYSNKNWLPLYWQGFSQTTRYTYRLNDISNTELLWDNLQDNIRREIRKAINRENLQIQSNLSIQDFLRLNRMVFERQGTTLPYSEQFILNLDKKLTSRQSRKIFIAVDESGRHHAGVYIIWDQNSAYYLMGGGDPELRNSGATSLCMWEAIKFSSTVSKSFDFEGSMIEPVERFFRSFGATQTPYFSISKVNSRLLKGYFALKDLFRKQ